jgi:hypothetical protein
MPVIIYARNRSGFSASHDDGADSRRGTTEAVKYQIVVMFVIARYDGRHRLRLDRLATPKTP